MLTINQKAQSYELVTDYRLMPDAPVMIRLDGRAFHTYCKGVPKSPDSDLIHNLMVNTTIAVMKDLQVDVGYTQSDEITLCFAKTDIPYNRRIQKLCSIVTSITTAHFNKFAQNTNCAILSDKLAMFDGRAWSVPDLDTATLCFIHRELDAYRNSVNSLAQTLYSPKELSCVPLSQVHDMIMAKGYNWNSCPSWYKRGSYVIPRNVDKERYVGERMQTVRYTRRIIGRIELPPILRLANPVGVLFNQEIPILKADENNGHR